ncbi:MAG TPA: LiaF domain-containing protein [Acidimicrobiia bacterium]|nr:LiaF domain-containing protein [Acidimicrobiia bacterium]
MWRRMLKVAFALNLAVGLAAFAARLVLVSRGEPDSDEVDLVTIFEGLHLRSHASAFMGGSTRSIFGGIVLDLRRAQLGPTGAELLITTLFGGTVIVAPPDWRIEVQARSLFGGLDRSDEPPSDPEAPVLTIRATTLFGGLQIESRPRLESVS